MSMNDVRQKYKTDNRLDEAILQIVQELKNKETCKATENAMRSFYKKPHYAFDWYRSQHMSLCICLGDLISITLFVINDGNSIALYNRTRKLIFKLGYENKLRIFKTGNTYHTTRCWVEILK